MSLFTRVTSNTSRATPGNADFTHLSTAEEVRAHRVLSVLFAVVSFAAPVSAEASASSNQAFSISSNDALTADKFMDFTTRRSTDPSFETTARIVLEGGTIVVTFRAHQTSRITANQTVNDIGFGLDDFIEVAFDTNSDGNRIYSFAVNPRCVRYSRSSENSRYRPSWQSECTIGIAEWHGTLRIPISIMRLGSSLKQQWRINILRHIASEGDDLTWAFEPQMSSPNDPNAWPHVSIQLPARRTLLPTYRIYGLYTAGKSAETFPQPNGSTVARSGRTLGLDLSQPISPTFNLVATLNPDFSNVEHDQETIFPQEFPRQLVEYRPFFSEGATFVDPAPRLFLESPPDRLFYSPNIGSFRSGIKAEGTIGRSSLGVLDIQRNSMNDFAYGVSFSNPAQTMRLFADGVVAQHSQIRDATSELGFTLQDHHSGLIGSAWLAHETGSMVSDPSRAQNLFLLGGIYTATFQLEAGYRDVGPEYSPIDGFTAINDIKGPILYGYYEHDSSSLLKTIDLYLLCDRYVNTLGVANESDFQIQAQVITSKLFSVAVGSSTSVLTTYQSAFPHYLGAQANWYNGTYITVGHKLNTTSAIKASYSVGVFGQSFLQRAEFSIARQLGKFTNGGIDIQQINQQLWQSSVVQRQTLARVSLFRGLTRNTNVTVSYRFSSNKLSSVSTGNLALGFQGRFDNGDEAYLSFGSPATPTTLDRFLVKYVHAIP